MSLVCRAYCWSLVRLRKGILKASSSFHNVRCYRDAAKSQGHWCGACVRPSGVCQCNTDGGTRRRWRYTLAVLNVHVVDQYTKYQANGGFCKIISPFSAAVDMIQKSNEKRKSARGLGTLYRTVLDKLCFSLPRAGIPRPCLSLYPVMEAGSYAAELAKFFGHVAAYCWRLTSGIQHVIIVKVSLGSPRSHLPVPCH